MEILNDILLVLFIFILHWELSLAVQSIFMHRYSAHKQFEMKPGVEKIFWVMAFLFMGPSYLSAYVYGVLHRLHHAYSDTDKDPHPADLFSGPWGLFKLMWRTKVIYSQISKGIYPVNEKMKEGVPEWRRFDRFASSWWCRLAWAGIYISIYIWIDPPIYCYLLIPFHLTMAPVHGAIINWFAHKYGKAPNDTGDSSKNLFENDILMGGEAYHNDHHKFPSHVNFGAHGQFDRYYRYIIFLDKIGILKIKN
ncbi:fatty acid desaturase [Candidatus Nomurabacteria bacterium]|nr:MAG: fatty acid desaturase [Candidatus Nomurabacteria bacterium]